MLKRRSTKGKKRGPYRRYNNRFERYVSDMFCERLEELNISQMDLIESTGNKISQPTLSRILRGSAAANINTIATVAEMLGLEIIIRPKQTEDDEVED